MSFQLNNPDKSNNSSKQADKGYSLNNSKPAKSIESTKETSQSENGLDNFTIIVLVLTFLFIVIVIIFIVILSLIYYDNTENDYYPTIGQNLEVINQLIDDLGDYQLPLPDSNSNITGTLNNFDCSKSDIFYFEGDKGNKTTTGYYIKYNAQVENVKSSFEFYVNVYQPDEVDSDDYIKLFGKLNAGYTASIEATGTAKVQFTVYTPEYEVCESIPYPCPTWDNPGKICYDKECVTIPSTYTGIFETINVDFTLKIKDCVFTADLEYKASNESSILPENRELKNTYVNEYKGNRFFMYDLLFNNMKISYADIDFEISEDLGFGIKLNDSDIEKMLDDITKMLEDAMADYFNSFNFQII